MKDNKLEIAQLTPKDWELTKDQKLNFQSLYILNLITEEQVLFPNFLTGRLRFAEDAIAFLEDSKLIYQEEQYDEKKVLGFSMGKSDIKYVYKATDEAFQVVKSYKKRYLEYLKLYDVYAYVDPEAGKFAMNKFKKIMLKEGGKEAWWDYLNNERWVDYRIPVATFKGIDPREFIFFSFIEEGKFAPSSENDENEWAEKLFLGSVWDDMYAILESAPIWEEQGDDLEESKEIMQEIISAGADVILSQRKKLDKYISQQNSKIAFFDEVADLMKEEDIDDEDYFDDPVHHHGMHQYTPLNDPLFWLTAAVVI